MASTLTPSFISTNLNESRPVYTLGSTENGRKLEFGERAEEEQLLLPKRESLLVLPGCAVSPDPINATLDRWVHGRSHEGTTLGVNVSHTY